MATLPFAEFDFIQKSARIIPKSIGADTIYANNENRRYCTENCIMACFVRKDPKTKNENEEHYGVGRFGLHMSNAAMLATRQLAIDEKETQRQKRRA